MGDSHRAVSPRSGTGMSRSPRPKRAKMTSPKKSSRPAIHALAAARLMLVRTTAPKKPPTMPGSATRTSTFESTLPTRQCAIPLTSVVGTVSAAEFLVAVSVSIGFLTGLTAYDIPWLAVGGLVLGGVLVAPFAARLAGRLPHAPMGTMVGGLIILVNGITITAAAGGLPGWLDWSLMLGLVAGTSWVAVRAWRREKAERLAAEQEQALVEV